MSYLASISKEFRTKVGRHHKFALILTASLLIPAAIPTEGLDWPYFFIMILVLSAWFSVKWNSVNSLVQKSKPWEIVLAATVVVADYAENAYFHSTFGLIDMIIVFCAVVTAFYGFRAFKLFWVPATYGVVLLLGYQLENILPNFVALQNWMAEVIGDRSKC